MGNALPLFFTVLTSLCLALVFFALWRSLRVLIGDAESTTTRAQVASDRQALLLKKQSLLQSLRDLEQERDMGKVSQDDFETMNARLRGRARDVIQKLDAQVAPFRAQAESLVVVLGGAKPANVTTGAAPSDSTATTVDPQITGAATQSATTDAPQCPSCQTKNETDAVFCKKCGHKLAADADNEGTQS